MTDREITPATRAAARELADLCAQIRAQYPTFAWRQNLPPPPPRPEAPKAPKPAPRARIASSQSDARLQVVIAGYRAGLSLEAIGVPLGLTRGAVEQYISRARRLGSWPEDLRRPGGRKKASEA